MLKFVIECFIKNKFKFICNNQSYFFNDNLIFSMSAGKFPYNHFIAKWKIIRDNKFTRSGRFF